MKSGRPFLLLSLGVALIVTAAAFVIPQLLSTDSASLAAGTKMRDDLATVGDVVKAVPTGESYLTKLTPEDEIEFRVVEMEITETLRGNAAGKIRLLQTVGWKENPALRKGREYLLFLEPYVGPIPKTEGVYVSTSGSWSYYQVGKNDMAVPLYDPQGEIAQWVASVSRKAPKGGTAATYSLVQWLRDMRNSPTP